MGVKEMRVQRPTMQVKMPFEILGHHLVVHYLEQTRTVKTWKGQEYD